MVRRQIWALFASMHENECPTLELWWACNCSVSSPAHLIISTLSYHMQHQRSAITTWSRQVWQNLSLEDLNLGLILTAEICPFPVTGFRAHGWKLCLLVRFLLTYICDLSLIRFDRSPHPSRYEGQHGYHGNNLLLWYLGGCCHNNLNTAICADISQIYHS